MILYLCRGIGIDSRDIIIIIFSLNEVATGLVNGTDFTANTENRVRSGQI